METTDQAGVIVLLCRSCTREISVQGVDNLEAMKYALGRGWGPDGARMICPKCPAARIKIRERAA